MRIPPSAQGSELRERRRTRTKRGTGSIRQRAPGVWEIRVVVGFDPVHGRSVQRSFAVHGDAQFSERRRGELVDDYGVTRVDFTTPGARLTVGELLERFFEAPHLWKPATVVSCSTAGNAKLHAREDTRSQAEAPRAPIGTPSSGAASSQVFAGVAAPLSTRVGYPCRAGIRD